MSRGFFRKRPVVVEAIRWTGFNLDDVSAFVGETPPHDLELLTINTLEGAIVAGPGDWIIRGVKGELYPCKPDVFDATYDRELSDV